MKTVEKLYSMIITGFTLTEENMLNYKMTKEEIKYLVDSQIIKQIEEGKYKLSSVEDLYEYGVNLLFKREYKAAIICFHRCHDIEPKNRKFLHQILISNIKRSNYQPVFEIFKKLDEIEPEKYSDENTLILYLLNLITDCPKEYQERISSISFDELSFHKGSLKEKDIIQLIMQNKFAYSLSKLNSIIYEEQKYCPILELLKTLLSKASDKEKAFRSEILDAAKKHEYQRIISLLEVKTKKRYLGNAEIYIQMICNEIIKIQETEIIPEPTTSTKKNKNDLYEALISKDYQLAMKINQNYLNFAKPNLQIDIINVLLTDLNYMISEIQLSETKQQERAESDTVQSTNLSAQIEQNNPSEETTHNESPKEDGLSDIEEMAYYISSIKSTFATTTKKLGLLPETILLIKLIYARDYYIEDNILMGDALLEEVEKAQNKSKRVISLLDEIRTNKHLYKNRTSSSHTRRLIQN